MSDAKANEYLTMAQTLFTAQDAARIAWKSVVSKVMPELLPPASLAENQRGQKKSQRVCPEAAEAVKKLASAHSNYITPIGFRFFRFADWNPGKTETDAEIDKWYAHASDVAQEAIERSNFHTSIISVYIDRVATGTVQRWAYIQFGTYWGEEVGITEEQADKCLRALIRDLVPQQINWSAIEN